VSDLISKSRLLKAMESEQLRIMGEHQSVTGYHKRYVTGKYDGIAWVQRKIHTGQFDAHVTQMQTDTTQNEQAIIRQFLNRLDWMAGTGNGIGTATVEKIRQFAIREGFLPPGGANER